MIALRRIVIVGATSLIAQHVARLWVAEGPAEVHLVGRDSERLQAIGRDLSVRSAGTVTTAHVLDVLNLDAVEALAQSLTSSAVDLLLVAHGTLPSQRAQQDDRALAAETLLINGNSTVLLLEAFIARMDPRVTASVVVIGSVAGDRGRRTNYVYGAAKALVATYVGGLQHRLASTAIHVILVKPGPTATPMTASLGRARMASPERVAADIVKGVAKGAPVIYTPAIWRLIMLIIRHLPRVIFSRISV